MKKILITALILISINITASACEICGCGTGSYYLGLLPKFHHHFIGLRYQYSSYNTQLKEDASEFSKDHFNTIELWGGWNIGKRWQVLGMVPYNFIRQVSDEGTTNKNGLGDIAVMGNYKVLDIASSTASKKLVSQQLWLGAGIKLATGKFIVDKDDEELVSLANTQTGTASTDFILNAMYNIEIGNFGVSTGTRYKMNTANRDHYFFGDKFSVNSFAFYSFKNKKTVFTPNAGLLYEHNDASKLNKEKIDMTGGYLLSTAAGVEININNITVGMNAQLPLSQNFAENQTKNKIKGMLHISFSL